MSQGGISMGSWGNGEMNMEAKPDRYLRDISPKVAILNPSFAAMVGVDSEIKVPEENKKKQANDVIDLTDILKNHAGLVKNYQFRAEQDLAKYAVTKFIRKYGTMARDSRCFSRLPSTVFIETDIGQTSKVFRDVTAYIDSKIEGSNEIIKGFIQAIQYDDFYGVAFSASTTEEMSILENEYMNILEHNNFFQGKSLRFSRDGVVFIPSPEMSLEEAVLPEKIMDEYKLNIIDFLSNDKYHDITKKRALLLYGPPGSGKTTSLKALFSVLRKKGITCMYLTDDTFRGHSLESIFDFINKYLTPCLIGFEDIDLIGEDRSHRSGIIGSLLSVLNGVEDYLKPIVIIGTTNRADILDDAVTRPCRFDRKLFIDYPTTEALEKMFENLMGFKAPKNAVVQSRDKKNKLTGAHIKEICNTAKILAKHKDVSVESCIKEAVQVISESFYLATPSVGFGKEDDGGEFLDDFNQPKPSELEAVPVKPIPHGPYDPFKS